MVLDGKKIDYDSKQDKKEIKSIFGKHFKKSRKYFRVSANTKTSFLEDDLLVSQLFEIFTILKYVDLDLQSTAEIEENIISYFGEYFRILCNNPKTFDFLGSFLNTLPEPKQLELMRHFFINCHQLRNDALLFNFLDKNISKIPVNDSLINPSLWSCSAGCLLGLFLVLKNNKILEAVLNSFLNSEIFDCEYLHRFVDILASLCNDKQKAEVKKKLKSAKIFHPEDAPLQK